MAEAEKMKFEYFAGEQRTAPWYELRKGKVTASRLEDWLSVSQAKDPKVNGKPLKKRLDYEKELQYERQFDVAYDNFVSDAMNDGIIYEQFAIMNYQDIKKVKVVPVGAWYNEHFVASPDGGVGDEGLVEVKVVRDNTFSEILSLDSATSHFYEEEQDVMNEKTKKLEKKMVKIGTGVPEKHWKQIQGQLWASGRKWCDYIAINLSTKKLKVIRVLPDPEFIEWLELAVPEPINVKPFSDEELFDFVQAIPEGEPVQVLADHSDNAVPDGF